MLLGRKKEGRNKKNSLQQKEMKEKLSQTIFG